MVDGLLFQEGLLAGFVQGVQQFETRADVELLMHPKFFVTIWKFRVDGRDWVFVHPRSVRVSAEVQQGAVPRNSSAISRQELSERLVALSWWNKVKVR
jgi:hypothetical protein